MKFEIGEKAIFVTSASFIRGKSGSGAECEIMSTCLYGVDYNNNAGYEGNWYWCKFEDDPSYSGLDGCWAVEETDLKKKKPNQESKDIEETRKGDLSWTKENADQKWLTMLDELQKDLSTNSAG